MLFMVTQRLRSDSDMSVEYDYSVPMEIVATPSCPLLGGAAPTDTAIQSVAIPVLQAPSPATPAPLKDNRCWIVKFFSAVAHFFREFFCWLFGWYPQPALPSQGGGETALPVTIAGLPNISNSCYLNATLQLFASSTEFDPLWTTPIKLPNLEARLRLTDDALVQGVKTAIQPRPWLPNREQLKERFLEAQRATLPLRNHLQKQLGNIITQIRAGKSISYDQMVSFYQCMRTNGWPHPQGKVCDQPEVFDFFADKLPYGPVVLQATKLKTDDARLAIEPSRKLILAIPDLFWPKIVTKLPAIQQLVNAHLGEGVDDKERKKITAVMGQAPQAVVLQIKRTNYSPQGGEKRFDKPVLIFDQTITLPFYQGTKADIVTYRLKSISLHTGTPTGGHYRAISIRSDGALVEANDSRVSVAMPGSSEYQRYIDDINNNNYLSVYERV